MNDKNIGYPFKKGQVVRITDWDCARDGIYVVECNKDFNSWGSVKLENVYPPTFTHKGGIELI